MQQPTYSKYSWLLVLCACSFIVIATSVSTIAAAEQLSAAYLGNALEIDAQRNEYFALEQSLWQFLDKPRLSKEAQLKKIVESHRQFINNHMLRNFEAGQFEILNHYEWSLMERDLLQIDGIFGFFRSFINKVDNSIDLDERAVLDIADTVLRNDKTFSMSRIFDNIDLVMVKQTMFYRAMMESKDQICQTQQSAQQFLYSLYTDIALTELKGYTMMEFSWMILRVYGKGNFTHEADLMRMDFQARNERAVRLLREVMRRADRVVWRCDPPRYIPGETYEEVTKLLQGFVENEVNFNSGESCMNDCAHYQSTKTYGCFKNKFCRAQPKCKGGIYNCEYVDSDMWVCLAPPVNSSRRYEYVEYENGRVYGKKVYCARGTTKVDSWWRYLFWHCSYCFCLCDEQMNSESDRYFSLRESLADVKNNKIVTGLRFRKFNRVFHIQIQQGELLPRGAINGSTLSWRSVHEFSISNVRLGHDYHMLTFYNRTIDLDEIVTDDNSFVVTGVRFRMVGTHLNLEVKLSEINFETGKLVSPEVNSFWKSNDNTDVSGDKRRQVQPNNPDIPTRSLVKSQPDSKDNQFITFTNTGMLKDAAQTTIPFIDIQDVVTNPPVPLAGVGIYHKGTQGFGGFLGPKIVTYDFTPHVQMPPPKPKNPVQAEHHLTVSRLIYAANSGSNLFILVNEIPAILVILNVLINA